jgi:DNA polymerase-3 subunit epsilon/ATP-dependent DNA helicase DinG
LVRTADGVVKLAGKFDDIAGTMTIEDSDDLTASLTKLGRQLAETSGHMNGIISEPDDSRIYWIESSRDRISLHVAPLHVGPLVQEHIFESKQTVVLASATLQTAKSGYGDEPSFEYIRKRLHGFEASEMAVGSPFDYQASTLVYLPTDMPEPNQPGYQRYVEQAIYDVATTLGGRTMALFTSYGQLNETAKALQGQLKQQGIDVLLQSGGMSRQQLTEQFKHPEARVVLFGTKSFWEGVDIPGPALSAVCLVRIPFDVPSDPVFAARSETFENSFFEYSIPEAVLRFRQGFGRLIRRTDDEGVVVILDKRVLSKRYGAMFLEALPDCVFLRQRSNRLSELVERWFNRDR